MQVTKPRYRCRVRWQTSTEILPQPNSIPDVGLSQSESSGLTFDPGAAVRLSRFHTLVTATPLS